MGNEITDIKAFLDGGKPAFLYNHTKPKLWFYDDSEVEQLRSYPFVNGIHAHLPRQTLYFQDGSLQKRFLVAVEDIEPDSPAYHEALGIALGYPPKASYFYAHRMESADKNEIAGIEYNGIGCISSIEDIKENVEWIWAMYPRRWFVKRDVELSHAGQWFQIKYKDHGHLQVVAATIIEEAPAS